MRKAAGAMGVKLAKAAGVIDRARAGIPPPFIIMNQVTFPTQVLLESGK